MTKFSFVVFFSPRLLVVIIMIHCIVKSGSSMWESQGAGDRAKMATPVLVLVQPQGPSKNRAVSTVSEC